MSKIIPKTKFSGLFTRHAVTKNKPDTAFVARNIKIDGLGIRPIKGTSLFGNNTTTAGNKIRDSYTFTLQSGTEIPVRVRDDDTNNVVEWYDSTNDKWYTLLKQTKDLNTSFTDFNSTTKNQLIWGNGTDNLTVWSGNKTTLTAAVTATDVTINVVSTAGFPATGTIIYNGTEIAYTGKAATTFTVGSAHASAGADDGVAEAADDTTYSGVEKGDVMISALNRLWIRSQTDKNSIEYSDEGDALTYTGGSGRADSGIEDFPVFGGDIRGISVKDDWMIFFKENTIIAFTFNYPDSTTKVPDYKNISVAKNIGAINHKGIAVGYNEIIYTTKNGIRSLAKVPSSTRDFNTDPISNRIKTTIKDYDFSEASAVYYDKDDVFLVACKSNSDQTNNNKVIALWFYNEEDQNGNEIRRSDFSILDLTVDSWFVRDSKLYFGSSMDGNTYQLFTGTTFNGTTIITTYTDNRNDFGKKVIKKMQHYLVEGLISDGTKIDYKMIFDGGRISGRTAIIDSAGDYVSKKEINSLGSFLLGEQVLGGITSEVDGLKPFRVVIECPDLNFYDLQIERKCTIKGGDYIIYFEGAVEVREHYDLTPDL